MYFRHLLLALCLCLLPGCGLIDEFFLPPPEDTAQELFEMASDAMQAKDYPKAIDAYTRLKDNFPFSPYTVEAELNLGDAYYLDERYPEAAEVYKDFESLHPRHEALAYVLYQVGMADLQSFISVDRPTTAAQEAVDYFNRLIDTFPDSEYAAKAPEEIARARHIIAEHELYLGDVFWNIQRYGPAWRRYTYVVENFEDVPDVHEHARKKAVAAYYEYRKEQSEEKREELEGTWKRFFKWM